MQLSEHAKELLSTLVDGDPWAMVAGVRSRVEARFAELGGHVEEQGPDQEYKCPKVLLGTDPHTTARCKFSGLPIGFNSPSPYTCQEFREMKDPSDVVSELGAEVNALIIVMIDILGCDIEDLTDGIKDQYEALRPRNPHPSDVTPEEDAAIVRTMTEPIPGDEPSPLEEWDQRIRDTIAGLPHNQGRTEVATEGGLMIEATEPGEGDILIEIKITDLRK
jgi:hypothetical protein